MRPSKWGNPYVIGAPHPATGKPMSRAEVVELFRLGLYNDPITPPKYRPRFALMRADIHELYDKVIGCCCKPYYACHGDALKEYTERDPAMEKCKDHGFVVPIVREKGPHLGLYCPDCGKWIKWGKKGEYEATEVGAYGAHLGESYEAISARAHNETNEPADEECPF